MVDAMFCGHVMLMATITFVLPVKYCHGLDILGLSMMPCNYTEGNKNL